MIDISFSICIFVKVHAKNMLSPGKHTLAHAKRIDHQRKKRLALASKRVWKRARLQKKLQNLHKESCCESREGPTYETGVALQVSYTKITIHFFVTFLILLLAMTSICNTIIVLVISIWGMIRNWW